ncbi:MAG: ADP-ribosylation factor-like protein [Candidatus Hermodarchaeota archaeon]
MIYYRHFGKALKDEVFKTLFADLIKEAFAKGTDKVDYHDYFKYRISYITESKLELIFLFVTGLTDNFDNIKKELIKCKKEFLNLFDDIIRHKYDEKTFEVFDPTIDVTHKNLRPKISLVGFSGVGKTTITRLIKAEEIPMQHIPTITGDIATIKIGKLHFHLWDFAGQEQFSYLWNNFIKGSDAVLLITDSTLENVEKSKFFLELIKEQAPHAHTAVIGNKQDLENAMKPEQIEKILALKTYSMIAKDPENRDKMITIIADILEMSAEVSPLLQPLLRRDTYIEEATKALENAEFEKAANLFEKISDLCIELGDDSLGREFFEKSQKIITMIQQISVPQSTTSPKTQQTEPLGIPPSKVEEVDIPSTPPAGLKPPIKLKEPVEKVTDLKKPMVLEKPPELKPKIIKEPEVPGTIDAEIQPIIPEDSVTPPTDEIGLNLNPEDFMVKQRPKTVTVVPKDAKEKLSISPYGQVKNQEAEKEIKMESPEKAAPLKPTPSQTPLIPPKPVVPTKIEEPIKETPQTIEPKIITGNVGTEKLVKPMRSPPSVSPEQISEESIETIQQEAPSPEPTSPQKSNLEKTLIDLKIKKANLSKMALEFDMKELTGEITAKELEDKKGKLREIEANINNQIKEIEDLLKQIG